MPKTGPTSGQGKRGNRLGSLLNMFYYIFILLTTMFIYAESVAPASFKPESVSVDDAQTPTTSVNDQPAAQHRVSLLDFSPFPKVVHSEVDGTIVRKRRVAEVATVLTSTPYKMQLIEKASLKNM